MAEFKSTDADNLAAWRRHVRTWQPGASDEPWMQYCSVDEMRSAGGPMFCVEMSAPGSIRRRMTLRPPRRMSGTTFAGLVKWAMGKLWTQYASDFDVDTDDDD